MRQNYINYIVTSPEMYEVVPILDDGSGPKEYFCDFAEVLARDPLEAKVKAIRSKNFIHWKRWQEENDESPYKGLTARKK